MQGITDRATGPQVMLVAGLLGQTTEIPDDPDPSYDRLLLNQNKDPNDPSYVNPAKGGTPVFNNSNDAVDLIVFGTGVRHNIPTVTSDVTFVKKLRRTPGIRQPQVIEVPTGTFRSKK